MSDTKSSNPKDLLAASERRCLLHLIPSPGLIATALAMQNGAEKYGPYNWREEGVGASTYVSAALRHIRTWLDGEEDASDSKVHHLGHAAACLMILLDAQAVGNLVDDRPAPAPTGPMLDQVKAADPLWGVAEEMEDQLRWSGEPQDPESYEPTVDDVNEYVHTIGGFEEYAGIHAAARGVPRKETAKIDAIDVYESTFPMLNTEPILPEPAPEEPHPNPFMAELGYKASDAEPGPSLTKEIMDGPVFEWETDAIEPAEPEQFYGVSIAEEMERSRKEIIEALSEAGLVNPEKYVTPNYGPIKLRRNQEASHWRYDQGCDCRKCEEHEYLMRHQRKEADSPDSESTPNNPNGGCC